MLLPDVHTGCCIVGGGPAGLMLGYLLARAGVAVTVLEKHADFLRDFRGDTIHPSTLEIMHHLGLLTEFLALPHQRVEKLRGEFHGETVTLADFSHLPTRCKFMAFMPQWEFLNFLANHAEALPGFTLLRSTTARELLNADGRVCGVVAAGTDGTPLRIHAALVVGTDGRQSMVRAAASLPVREFGAPRDVVWIKLPKQSGDANQASGHGGPKNNFIMLDRGDYWQCGYSIEKGSFDSLRRQGLAAFLRQVADVAPFSYDRFADAIGDWPQAKLLVIRIDRLQQWAAPGVLCIGDAAHAMSPIGGIGVNLAIQDAVATANLLAAPLLKGRVSLRQLNRVQRRRRFPTWALQSLQIMMTGKNNRPQKKTRGASAFGGWMRRQPWVPLITGRIIGLGFRAETPRPLPPETPKSPR
ncbi:FAD-dependent oxidoreductase [Acerihabitans arboris]|uniref:FAD-dependent oxidoreductase n=1 Tax=Acerihabitans arboris TaxID=2691583 RepID=A0A845SFM0_9GAMM|nr:FAD-dependent oxidoreductase [Acerihabitans arboris]NDL61876.1 FAD-dependent oxidoreductase [Acerihabitans arboris]